MIRNNFFLCAWLATGAVVRVHFRLDGFLETIRFEKRTRDVFIITRAHANLMMTTQHGTKIPARTKDECCKQRT